MKRLFSKLFNCLIFLFLSGTRRLRPQKKDTGSVLLVHFAHIGDFVVWLDSAYAYRKLYPEKKIVFLCRKFKSVYQLVKEMDLFDEIIEVDDGWRWRLFSVLRMMCARYDIVINTRLTRDLQSDLYVLAPRSCQRIAPSSDLTCISEYWLRRSDAAYTSIIPCDGIGTMELVRNAQFVRGLGLSNFKASVPVLPKFTPPEGLPQRFFVVCPGASNPANRWPGERFAAVIDAMVAKYKIPCILIGTKEERPIGERIRRISAHPDMLYSLMGKTSLTEYTELIRRADFLISNDTSAGHIAPAVQTPTIVIQPGWNYGRFFPYQVEQKTADLPVSVVAAMDCIGCGKDPTLDGDKECLCDNVMRCILNITQEDVIERFQIKKGEKQYES